MKLWIGSDLHLEFDYPRLDAYFGDIKPDKDAVLILAGDICTPKLFDRVLPRLCALFAHVVAVLGNHDVYGMDPNEAVAGVQALALPNLHLLHRSSATLNGLTFAGCMLWPDPLSCPYPNWTKGMDFHAMRRPQDWIRREHLLDMDWLTKESEKPAFLRPEILVTHFVPHMRGIAPKYLHDPGNWYFHVPADKIVDKLNPALIVCGHTHTPADADLPREKEDLRSVTRLLCNPRGYPSEGRRARFNLVDVVLEPLVLGG